MFGLSLSPWMIIGAAIAAAVIAVSSFGAGYHVRTLKAEADMAERDRKVAEDNRLADEERTRRNNAANALTAGVIAAAVEENQRLSNQLARLRAEKQTQKEIATHVTPTADARCVVPVGFVRVWNDSIADKPPSGEVVAPAPATDTDDDGPSGVALSAVAGAASDNHSAYKECKADLSAWQKYGTITVPKWYGEVQTIWKGASP